MNGIDMLLEKVITDCPRKFKNTVVLPCRFSWQAGVF